jgi:hypothetical protein
MDVTEGTTFTQAASFFLTTASAIDTASRRFEVVTSTINTLPGETFVGTIANPS